MLFVEVKEKECPGTERHHWGRHIVDPIGYGRQVRALQADEIAVAPFHPYRSAGVHCVPAKARAHNFRQLREAGRKSSWLLETYEPSDAPHDFCAHAIPKA